MMVDYVKKLFVNKEKRFIIFSILLTLCYLYGDIYVKNKEISVFLIIKLIFIFLVYYLILNIYIYLSSKDYAVKFINANVFNSQLKLFLIIFVMWLPHLLVRYPVAFWFDEYVEVLMGLGERTLTSHFSVLYTYILTGFYKFGELLGDHNIGMFLFSLIHCVILANIFVYTIRILSKLNVKKWMLILFVLFYVFCPFVAGNIGTTTKDIYYSGYLVLFTSLLLLMLFNSNEFWNNKVNIILFCLSSILVSLIRKNGLYVIIPTLIVILLVIFKNNNYKRVLCLLLTIIFSIISLPLINSISGAQNGSITEAFSIPFQQTARFVKYHSDLVTNDEKEIIDKILPFDEISKLYDFDISDPVKNNARPNADSFSSDYIDYFVVWFKQFFKAPLTYINATFRQNIYLLYPGINNYEYKVECNGGILKGKDQSLGLVQSPLWLKENIQSKYWSLMNISHELPILRIVNNMTSFIILFITTFIFIVKRKCKNKLIVLTPILLSLLVIIASPSILIHLRYSFPIIYSFPIWFGILSIEEKIS